jgi:hypothetical protein
VQVNPDVVSDLIAAVMNGFQGDEVKLMHLVLLSNFRMKSAI